MMMDDDEQVEVEVTEYWCPTRERWTPCNSPCPDGSAHDVTRTRMVTAQVVTPRALASALREAAAERERAERLLGFLQHLADLPIHDGPHAEDACGCPIHQAQRFLQTL